MELKHKTVVVIGMGLSGVSAARLLAQKGARVIINDYKSREELTPCLEALKPYPDIKIVTGGHPEGIVNTGTDLVVKNPGIPMDIKPLKRAGELGIKVITEVELAYLFTRAPIIGITGTNGKTTTTALLGEIFKEAGKKVYVAGNIGVPLCDIAEKASADSWIVAELSSFQLEGIEKFKPKISAILNISEDHMDRHETLGDYLDAKKRIFLNQKDNDFCVLNQDDLLLSEIAVGGQVKSQVVPFSRQRTYKNGIYVKDQHIVISKEGKLISVCPQGEVALPGKHNLENVLAATAAAYAAGIKPEIIGKTLRTFKGVAHRLESVGKFKGIVFINDSKGTNVEATIKALDSFSQPIILIAGGKDKGGEFNSLSLHINKKVKHLILLGETSSKIIQAVENEGFTDYSRVQDLDEAVTMAYQLGKEGDLVLLSPACASWDMFRSYEERGNEFKRAVRSLGRKMG
ncbi:UDP-N-acetylmuramoyl-L-alanine--D-glutamate ligase [Candidatus Contubernalis alkaliaceticus]|uniref:UDP-N-acetylmuramoyl-L-alanine--D-glutamate ligase n=1 Tax=Candidatus Contubernalis alkaliaceticus TaxID=338645 RepID=UPI001F4C3261|nr:UDP-N-acetylmuramoyl-L-alanine--D-glutamate ligase [Candidatus Contubernalis alkalaceticus]UNC92876.1 UDP-N-acetylmuramoyl-L-alanine--D-glutamate ligase [Candidatus Contubernalis alkalaceticus]